MCLCSTVMFMTVTCTICKIQATVGLNIQNVDQIKDLRILYDSHLTFKDHFQEKINKSYTMIGLIKRNFINMDSRTFIMLYKALVCPHVEYVNSVWSPFKKRKYRGY